MNPWDLSASELMIWGAALHLIADVLLQNDWMAKNKMLRRMRHNPTTMTGEQGTTYTTWWDRHPAAYSHAGVHYVVLSVIFGWIAIPLAIVHLIIDTRTPVEWWSKLIRQTQPTDIHTTPFDEGFGKPVLLVDVGLLVRFMTDQAFHIVCIAIAALIVG